MTNLTNKMIAEPLEWKKLGNDANHWPISYTPEERVWCACMGGNEGPFVAYPEVSGNKNKTIQFYDDEDLPVNVTAYIRLPRLLVIGQQSND